MKTFSIKQALQYGWKTFWEHWLFILAILLVSFVISWFFSFLSSAGDSRVIQGILSIVSIVVQILISIGIITVFLKLAKGETVSWNDMINNRKRFLPFFGASILYQIIVFIGLILLIVPGIYFAIKYQFAKYVIIDNPKSSIKEAFAQSSAMTKDVKWRLFGLMFAFFGVALLGLIALGVGLLVAIPTITIAHASIFYVLKKSLDNQPKIAENPGAAA